MPYTSPLPQWRPQQAASVSNGSTGECGRGAIKLLLGGWGNDLEITDKALCIAAKNEGCGERIISVILQHRADITLVTIGVLEEAAANIACGQEVARLLLAHGQIQRPVGLESVAFIVRSLNGQCVRLLLNRAGDEVTVSPDLLMEATRNPQVISLLLVHGREQISITEEAWETVIHGNRHRIVRPFYRSIMIAPDIIDLSYLGLVLLLLLLLLLDFSGKT
jgi:hypothetical protein